MPAGRQQLLLDATKDGLRGKTADTAVTVTVTNPACALPCINQMAASTESCQAPLWP